MKFLIRELGWDGWRAEFEKALRRGPGRGRRRAFPSTPSTRRSRPRPTAPARRRPPSRRRRARARSRGGARARHRPRASAHRSPVSSDDCVALAAHERAAAEAGRATRSSRSRCPSATSPAPSCACSPTSPLAYGDGTVRTTARPGPPLPLGARDATCRELLPPAGRRGPRPGRRGHAGRRHELPGRRGLPPRRHPVARPRPLLGDHLRARPDLVAAGPRPRHQDQRLPQRLRPAPRRRPRLPGQRAQGRRQGRAAVLRDGGRRRRRRPARASAAWPPRSPPAACRRRSSG